MPHVIVWDIETVPDLAGYAAANGHDGKSDDEIRAELGEKFPKHIYHSIICIGALIARRDNDHWVVEALGAPHVGERPEKELIAAFVDKIARLKPQLVTFNGSSFDLPVVGYRAMVHKVSDAGLSARPYFHRYNDAVDLCDVLSSFAPRVWLRHELFQGKLRDSEFEASESKLEEFIKARSATKPRLTEAIDSPPAESS